MHSRSGFTLIELLVVIAIIAILAAVVILTLNPGQLLKQSRDANRLSDLDSLNHALGVYLVDVTSPAFSTSSTVYVSVPDTSNTCANLNLPTLPAGWFYACASTSTYRNVDGTGWLPVNFTSISSGSPFGSLPVDPTNATSSGLYYEYISSTSTYGIAALLESQKYLKANGGNYLNLDPGRSVTGSNPALIAASEGLVGYWNFDEGSGSTAVDQSGTGNNGTWSGTASGTSGYYSSGKVGSWAGYFDGSSDYLDIGTSSAFRFGTGDFTMLAWFKPTSVSSYFIILGKDVLGARDWTFYVGLTAGKLGFFGFNGGGEIESTANVSVNQWSHGAITRSSGTVTLYVNGTPSGSASDTQNFNKTNTINIGRREYVGANQYFQGQIDDVRIYNRALSAAEIQAIYNAEK